MLSLLDCPNRVDNAEDDNLDGAPHAADGAYIDHGRDVSGYPTFVRWPALNHRGDRVAVLVGFDTIQSPRINDVLKRDRAAIEAAASAAYVAGQTEVVLIAT